MCVLVALLLLPVIDISNTSILFQDNHLFFGGNVRRLSHMHTSKECGGIPIVNPKTTTPLFMHGDIVKAISAVSDKESNVSSSDFYFFAGACFWEPGQLQQQVLEGTWLPLHAPVDTLLTLSLQDSDKSVGARKEVGSNSDESSESTNGESVHTIVDDSVGGDGRDSSDYSDVEEDERERQNRVWSRVMASASRNCSHLSTVPFTLHSASVEPLVWTGDDNTY